MNAQATEMLYSIVIRKVVQAIDRGRYHQVNRAKVLNSYRCRCVAAWRRITSSCLFLVMSPVYRC
jgi:hypothetical protein